MNVRGSCENSEKSINNQLQKGNTRLPEASMIILGIYKEDTLCWFQTYIYGLKYLVGSFSVLAIDLGIRRTISSPAQ